MPVVNLSIRSEIAAEQLRLSPATISMDEQGVLPDAFEQACRQHTIKAIYWYPTIG